MWPCGFAVTWAVTMSAQDSKMVRFGGDTECDNTILHEELAVPVVDEDRREDRISCSCVCVCVHCVCVCVIITIVITSLIVLYLKPQQGICSLYIRCLGFSSSRYCRTLRMLPPIGR